MLNHNLETVARLQRRVRPAASYERSLGVLRRAGELRPDIPTKSGLMLGLGERDDELERALGDLRAAGVTLLTLGQYLRPSAEHLPVDRYVTPRGVRRAAPREARALGFARGRGRPARAQLVPRGAARPGRGLSAKITARSSPRARAPSRVRPSEEANVRSGRHPARRWRHF